MRTLLFVFAVSSSAACGNHDDVKTGPFDPADAVHETADAVRVAVHRQKVPLEAMPIVKQTLAGVPMSGLADVDVDLEIPKVGGARQYAETTGSVHVSCPTGCALGDPEMKTTLPKLGDIALAAIAFDRFDAKVSVEHGKVSVTNWELGSRDLEMKLRLQIDLADQLDASKLDGCLRFKPSRDLEARDPKAYSILAMTGASRADDGFFQIAVGGRLGHVRLLAKACQT